MPDHLAALQHMLTSDFALVYNLQRSNGASLAIARYERRCVAELSRARHLHAMRGPPANLLLVVIMFPLYLLLSHRSAGRQSVMSAA